MTPDHLTDAQPAPPLPPQPQATPASLIAGALYDFAGYLTTLPTSFAVGSAEIGGPMVDHLVAFANKRRLSLDDPAIATWHNPTQATPAAAGWVITFDDARDFCRVSWAGLNVHGNAESIKAVLRALHDAGTVPELKQRMSDLNAATQAQAAPAAQVAENAPVGKMTARRAVYFLERFKHDEKMLGPNEQAGLDYAIATLEREQAAALGDPRFSWMDFQEIGELTAVDEAIRNMLNDQTEDNGVCMIRAICEAAADRLVALAARHRAFPAPMLYQQMALAKALHATSVDPDEWDALRQCEIDALRDRAVKIMTLLAT